MNGVCTHIIWLTKQKLTYYTGNYDTFCKTVQENEVIQQKKYEKEQDDIKHLKAFISSCGMSSDTLSDLLLLLAQGNAPFVMLHDTHALTTHARISSLLAVSIAALCCRVVASLTKTSVQAYIEVQPVYLLVYSHCLRIPGPVTQLSHDLL